MSGFEQSRLAEFARVFGDQTLFAALFEVALNKAYRSLSELHPNVHLHSDDDLKPLLVQLAENCFQSGIPEEETARWAIAHFYTQKKEFLIRQTVQNVYLAA